MIEVRLRDMIAAYEKRTGEKLVYADLAKRAGVSRATVESLASRSGCNATLTTIDRLCTALGCALTDLVHHEPEQGSDAAEKRPRRRRYR